ncbi:UDP-glycosyltransferase 90A1-like [Humulus lupulus]|uniref:UDP-glycosyltransferase 90A1-like n=1 Tax=Humulus lupulus TaxID=3486 RepID=UPI002B4097FD|nr:UDP-glycosyltransferase 90A1-like [Humulus lupulus]
MELSFETGAISPLPRNHVVLFPFMSKGHTIPLLHLSRLLILRCISVSFFTTPANRPFIVDSLSDTTVSIIDLPFPEKVNGIPAGVESTDGLPSMSLFHSFAMATVIMKPDFDRALKNLNPPPSFIVSDGFLWWTLDSASEMGLPRFVSYGMSSYAQVLVRVSIQYGLVHGVQNDEPITIPPFPWIKIRKDDIPKFSDMPGNSSELEFSAKTIDATSRSFGLIVNSFYDIESTYVDYFNHKCRPKAWCIGPLCLASPLKNTDPVNKSTIIRWLDQKRDEEEGSVLYVAFGSQAEMSSQQLKEIAIGLEESEVNFLWVLRKREKNERDSNEFLYDGFENRVKNRGMVVRDWVDQREILSHDSVQGFLSHCGWNAVIESICAGVPILVLPMTADQPLNAKMVVEEMKVGLRIETCDGYAKGFVKSQGLKNKVKELMEGETGKEVGKNVKEVAVIARKAMEEGGSSWQAFDSLIDEAFNYIS